MGNGNVRNEGEDAQNAKIKVRMSEMEWRYSESG